MFNIKKLSLLLAGDGSIASSMMYLAITYGFFLCLNIGILYIIKEFTIYNIIAFSTLWFVVWFLTVIIFVIVNIFESKKEKLKIQETRKLKSEIINLIEIYKGEEICVHYSLLNKKYSELVENVSSIYPELKGHLIAPFMNNRDPKYQKKGIYRQQLLRLKTLLKLLKD